MDDLITYKPISIKKEPPGLSKNVDLNQILKTREQLIENIKNEIYFSEPLILRENVGIIFPNTINIIQGKAGVHKSRLTEDLCSLLISNSNSNQLGFSKLNNSIEIKALYVDTERNLKDQFPFALQKIIKKAGYEPKNQVEDFDFISLIEINREQRFNTLTDYIKSKRVESSEHLFIILDVLTDCVSNFNDPKESMKLIDYMNVLINTQNVTFFAVIHENPGVGEKARGHLGTEVLNKASTVIQIGFEKGKNGEDSDLIKIKYLKTRNTKRPDPFYVVYSDVYKSLVLADAELVQTIEDSRKIAAPINEVKIALIRHLEIPKYREDLIQLLTKEFNCSTNTIDIRLKEIIERNEEFILEDHDEPCILEKFKDGHKTIYRFNKTIHNSKK